MFNKKNIKLYLQDILDSSYAINDYVKNLDINEFKKDRKTYSAVIREFEIIGESVGKLPEAVKNRYPKVEWQDIKDFRNLLIHQYFGVDLDMVWNVIKDDLPLLVDTVRKILLHNELDNY